MTSDFNELKKRLAEINALGAAASLLSWDQATYMPAKGAAARGRQMAVLREIAHERAIAPELGELLCRLESLESQLPRESFEASLIRVARRDYQRAIKIPSAFMAAFSEHTSSLYDAWSRARPESDFARLVPALERTVALSREYSAYFKSGGHVADPLIDFSDEGMTAATVSSLFASLRQGLVPLVRDIAAKQDINVAALKGRFDRSKQLAFGESVARAIGYDLTRGRQDLTRHPFMTKFSIDDVRITTRCREDDVTDSLFSTIHETGHALYEQGIDAAFEATPLACGTSIGVHESQSRLWENLVGRSRGFWEYFFPKLRNMFPQQLSGVSPEVFYRAINRVVPSLVRTDADEVTYNLHVMIRFDLELALLDGSLAVKDLPEAWNERYRSDLSIVPPNHAEGVLQDVHWYVDFIGGQFQGYAIGNILSAQFFNAAVRSQPSIPQDIASGRFDTLLTWLRTNIHRFGSQFTADEITRRATGESLSITPYLDYLRKKYGEIYGL